MVARPAMSALADWDAYYTAAPSRHVSAFGRWAVERFPVSSTVIDLGCGDGRDARAFADAGHVVTGVDTSAAALAAVDDPRIELWEADAAALADFPVPWDVGYMRWILHAVEREEADAILEWASAHTRTLYIEARSDKGEHPRDHYRRPINLRALVADLTRLGCELVYSVEGYGLSITGADDPFLLRVVARSTRA